MTHYAPIAQRIMNSIALNDATTISAQDKLCLECNFEGIKGGGQVVDYNQGCQIKIAKSFQ